LRRRRPTPGAQRLGRPISIGAKASGRRSACADREISFALAKADARRASALEGRFQSAGRPPDSGRRMRRMNSTSRGLRPTVGLRRPGDLICIGEGRRPARKRLGRPISIGGKAPRQRSADASNEFDLKGPSADGRPAPTGRSHLRRRRPTPGAQRLGRPISIGGKAPSQRSADASNEFDLKGPSADGRPAPTGRSHLRRRRPTPGAQAPWKADFNRREGLQPAAGPMRRMNSTFEGLRPTVGLRRPGDPICVGEGRRPARKRLGRPISIGGKAPSQRSADASNEFDLKGPSADGRPAPTGRSHLRRRRPTPGAQRLGRPISIGGKASSQRSARCVE
jgi:hypothetical protein